MEDFCDNCSWKEDSPIVRRQAVVRIIITNLEENEILQNMSLCKECYKKHTFTRILRMDNESLD